MEALARHLRLSSMGSLGQGNTLASENRPSQLRMRGPDMASLDAPCAYSPYLLQSLVRGQAPRPG